MLSGWDFDPDRVSVRIVTGDDGRDKLQLRLDLGLLQMEFDGRPDGAKVNGCDSWFEYYQQQQRAHDAANPDGAPFRLEGEDCVRLLREGVQYYHRYVSFWHLERYELCARDTNRNLRLFAFVREYARHNKDKLAFDQWRPYVTMMHTRAVATPLVELRDYEAALGVIDAGVEKIHRFLEEYHLDDNAESCSELTHLMRWREQVVAHRPWPAAGRQTAIAAGPFAQGAGAGDSRRAVRRRRPPARSDPRPGRAADASRPERRVVDGNSPGSRHITSQRKALVTLAFPQPWPLFFPCPTRATTLGCPLANPLPCSCCRCLFSRSR